MHIHRYFFYEMHQVEFSNTKPIFGKLVAKNVMNIINPHIFIVFIFMKYFRQFSYNKELIKIFFFNRFYDKFLICNLLVDLLLNIIANLISINNVTVLTKLFWLQL